ncbi:PAS domain-containing protein [Kiloniella antarctica]|uniref:PAS domain-containing protein n=1 Tax=Kiloniella antarctica TaxID=1550907 RepID=A0ABW5BJL5_9PROT
MLEVTFRTTAVERAYKYWLSKRPPEKGTPGNGSTDECQSSGGGAGLLPSRALIDPIEMRAFLPNVLLLDVQREPLDFRFRVVGTSVTPLLNRDYTSEWMSNIDNLKAPGKVWTNCSSAVEFGEPVYACTPYTGPKRGILDVEDLILPLAADGRTVDMLMIILAGTKKEVTPKV